MELVTLIKGMGPRVTPLQVVATLSDQDAERALSTIDTPQRHGWSRGSSEATRTHVTEPTPCRRATC